MIRKVGHSYRVYSSSGKLLGTYPNLKQAKKRLSQMEFFSSYKKK